MHGKRIIFCVFSRLFVAVPSYPRSVAAEPR